MPQALGGLSTPTDGNLNKSFLPFLELLPAACGDFQARGPIGAVATGLCQSHSNTGSKLRLQPTLQLTLDP